MADDEKTVEGEEEDEGKGSSKKLLIFGLIGGLAIGGGATFGVLAFLGGGDGAVEEEPVVEEEPLPEMVSEYVKINRIPAALSGPSGRQLGYVFFDLSLEVKNAEDRDWVLVRVPVLRDAFLRTISRNGVAYANRPTDVDYETLKARLKQAANAALERDIITAVLVINSVQAGN